MGCSASKNSQVAPQDQQKTLVNNKLIPYDPQTVNINLTEADEQLYSPKPPTRSRDQLIPDFTIFKRIDNHAKSVPNKVRSSISQLANYLMQPCDTDLEIVRAFYIWICHNISYDTTYSRPNDSESVIKSGVGVCQGYGNVFASLCRAVGIPVRIVTGYSKGIDYNPEKPRTVNDETDHAWNAVCIQKEWRFIEATWGSGHLDNGQYVRQVTDLYFLMEPKLMFNGHFPFMNYNEDMSFKWQLLTSPLCLDRFNKDVKLHSDALEWCVEVSPRTSLLEVKCKTQFIVNANRTPLINLKAVLRKNGVIQSGFILVEQRTKGEFCITVRPPSIGKYQLTMFANTSQDETTLSGIVTMALDVMAVEQNIRPYPDYSSAYGVNDPKTKGLAEKMRCGGVFLGASQTIDIPVETVNGVKIIHGLVHSETDLNDADRYVFPEKKSETLTIFHIRLPLRGFYEFRIFTKLPEETGTTYSHAGKCLVECVQPSSLGRYPLVYDAVKDLDCTLIKPDTNDLQSNTSVDFEISSSKLVMAEIQSGGKTFPMIASNNVWKGSAKIPARGGEVIIYGNNIASSLEGLYKFSSIS